MENKVCQELKSITIRFIFRKPKFFGKKFEKALPFLQKSLQFEKILTKIFVSNFWVSQSLPGELNLPTSKHC